MRVHPFPPSMLCWQESEKLWVLMGYMCRIGFRGDYFVGCLIAMSLYLEDYYSSNEKRFIYWNFEVELKRDNVSEKDWLKINNIKYRNIIQKLCEIYRQVSRRRIDAEYLSLKIGLFKWFICRGNNITRIIFWKINRIFFICIIKILYLWKSIIVYTLYNKNY